MFGERVSRTCCCLDGRGRKRQQLKMTSSCLSNWEMEDTAGGAGLGHATILKLIYKFFDVPPMETWGSFTLPKSGICDCLTNTHSRSNILPVFGPRTSDTGNCHFLFLGNSLGPQSPCLEEAIAACEEAM